MKIQEVPFISIDWKEISSQVFPGITGEARWKIYEKGNIRVRIVEFSPGYAADHWCNRGHVILVMEGEIQTELADGRIIASKAGETIIVSDDLDPHRSSTIDGATLFIVD